VKAGETIAQGVIAKGAFGANPLLQRGLRQFRLQLLETGQPEHEGMKGCQKDGGRGDFGIAAGIGQAGHGGAEVENFIEIAAKRRNFVDGSILPFHNCKIPLTPLIGVFDPVIGSGLPVPLALPVAPQQLAIYVGDLLQLILQLVVVFDPATDFIHFLLGDDAAGRAAWSESDG